MERQRDPVRAQRRSKALRRPRPQGKHAGVPAPLQPHAASPRATSFLPCRRTAGDAVPLAWPSAATQEVSTRRTAPLDGTEPAAILHGAGGVDVKGHGLGCAMAQQQWWWRTVVFPISCPVPSGCCRDGSTRPRGVGRERTAASRQPCHEHAGLGIRPAPNLVPGSLLETPCPASAGWLSPSSPRHKTPVSPWRSPSSVLPILLARCTHAPLALGEKQGRAVPSLQLPVPCCPSLWHQAMSRPFSSPILPSPGCVCPALSRPMRRMPGPGDATHRAQHPHGPGEALLPSQSITT